MSEHPPHAALSDPALPAFRHCLACNYNLTGLGDGPRCPECGLVHVPQAFREEVWKLVDSGRWFFSRMFHPFEKRLPGWWWALDRPGDVKRSLRFALCHTVFSIALIFIGSLLSECVTTKTVHTWYTGDPALATDTVVLRWEQRMDPWGMVVLQEGADEVVRRYGEIQSRSDLLLTSTTSASYEAPTQLPEAGVFFPLIVLSGWLWPAGAGLLTQLRRGMKSFACARRSVLSAAMYEAHRMSYAAVLFLIIVVVQVARVSVGLVAPAGMNENSMIVAIGILLTFSALGWIGPVRSDYTHQLVKSRSHAVRIVLFYGVFGNPFVILILLGFLGAEVLNRME